MLNGHTALMGYAGPHSFSTKAEALQYAIDFTATISNDGRTPDYDKAQELFDFICRNVTLSEHKSSGLDNYLATALDTSPPPLSHTD